MKPILFSTNMVQAILAGQKTMTRRVMNPQPNGEIKANIPYEFYGTKTERIFTDNKAYLARYSVGDILWVRETWLDAYETSGMGVDHDKQKYLYRADDYGSTYDKCWRPSIFMPKEACRIFLRVTDVRAERVQEITRQDMLCEGINLPCDRCSVIERFGKCDIKTTGSCKEKWTELWNSINDKRGYGWDTNPWVWVINFERCEKPEGV